MEECTIMQFQNAMLHPEECLHSCKGMECDRETLTRTKYFAECRAEHDGKMVMVYAPITPKSMTMIRLANSVLPANSSHVQKLHIVDNEILCVGFDMRLCPMIIEPLPEGTLLSEALYTHSRERLVHGLDALRNELQRYDVSINHLHPNSIIVDRAYRWHVIRPYYATHGFGNDVEAFDKLNELIARYSLSYEYDGNILHEDFAPYGAGNTTYRYPIREGLRRFSTPERFGYEDDKGNVVIEAKFRSASDFMEDRAIVQGDNHRWGIIDKRGRYIIAMEYDYVEFNVDDGTSEVMLNEQTAIFDYFGKQLTEWTPS